KYKDLVRHANNHEEHPHKCTIGECSKGFAKSVLLKQHLRDVHNLKPYHCSICGEMFYKLKELDHHQKKHDKMANRHESSPVISIEAMLRDSPSALVEEEIANQSSL
ncbi:hypothetical protein PENTCL1PPCAC_12482, partial [Pristionchus entomophagus]